MLIIISLLLILLSVFLIIKNPYVYLAFFCAFASSTEAKGIECYLGTSFSYYGEIQAFIFVIFGFISTFKIIKQPRYRTIGLLILLLVFFCWFSIFSKFGFSPSSYILISESLLPLGLPILLANPMKRENEYKVFNLLLIVEITLAFLITYLPLAGIDLLSPLASMNYAGTDESSGEVATMGQLDMLLGSKYVFANTGQFHNSNDMGLFGIVGLFWSFYYFIIRGRKLYYLPFCILLAFFSIAIWFNGAARGPIVGLVAGLFLYLFLGEKKGKFSFLLMILLVLGAIVYVVYSNEDIFQFFFDTEGHSYTTRKDLNDNGWSFLASNPILGAGGDLALLVRRNIDPHELPFRMACVFGIVPGLLTILLFYLYPISRFLKAKKKTLLSMVLYGIFFFISLTNNYTCIILDMFLLYFVLSEWSEEPKNKMKLKANL